MDEREIKPIIWKSILCVIPCGMVFFLTRILLTMLISFVGFIIYKIPILGDLLIFLFKVRGDGILFVATIASLFVAYCITTSLQEKMMKYAPTITLSRKILGVIMVLTHLCFLVVNIFTDGNYSTNILCALAALMFIFYNED